ncbi:MAG: DUF11 domain-containing protein, partial [Chloroflexi bacterium]
TAGQPVSYTVTVTNTATGPRNLRLVDQLPVNLRPVGCSSNCQIQANGQVQWDLGSIPPGESRTVSGELMFNSAVATRTAQSEYVVDHTITLLDGDTPVNVNTINARLADQPGPAVEMPSLDTAVFFVRDGLALPETDGLLMEIVSPAAPDKAVIIVTGLNDEAVLKAGRALSTLNLVPGIVRGDYALVQQFLPLKEPASSEPSKTTLAKLGYNHQVIENVQTGTLVYRFEIPWGVTLDTNNLLMLHFAHSAALSRINAVAVISLNDLPIGSIDLAAPAETAAGSAGPVPTATVPLTPTITATATTPAPTPAASRLITEPVIGSRTGWLKLTLPETVLLNGENTLEITLDSSENDVCSFLEKGSWFTVFNDSFIQTSYREGELEATMANYPQPFNSRAGIINTTFILPDAPTRPDFQLLLALVGELGRTSAGDTFWPKVQFGLPETPEILADSHLVAIGLPTDNSLIAQVNPQLPQPFIPGTSQIEQVVNNVIYRLPPQIDIGLLEELPSPWNDDRALLVATGTTRTGLAWAVRAASDPNLNWQLGGNLVVVNDKKLQAIDTRELFTTEIRQAVAQIVPELTPVATVVPPTPTPIVTPTPSPTPIPAAVLIPTLSPEEIAELNRLQTRPRWYFPALVLAAAVSVIVVALVILRSRY